MTNAQRIQVLTKLVNQETPETQVKFDIIANVAIYAVVDKATNDISYYNYDGSRRDNRNPAMDVLLARDVASLPKKEPLQGELVTEDMLAGVKSFDDAFNGW